MPKGPLDVFDLPNPTYFCVPSGQSSLGLFLLIPLFFSPVHNVTFSPCFHLSGFQKSLFPPRSAGTRLTLKHFFLVKRVVTSQCGLRLIGAFHIDSNSGCFVFDTHAWRGALRSNQSLDPHNHSFLSSKCDHVPGASFFLFPVWSFSILPTPPFVRLLPSLVVKKPPSVRKQPLQGKDMRATFACRLRGPFSAVPSNHCCFLVPSFFLCDYGLLWGWGPFLVLLFFDGHPFLVSHKPHSL